MKKLGWALNLGFAITGIATFGQSAAALPKANRSITVHVYNYAEVDRRTLSDAEKVATEIFRKAGVESQWVYSASGSENTQINPADQRPRNLSDFRLNILSRQMAEHIPLKGDVMGVAPGTGRDRRVVYAFYNQVETFAARQTVAVAERKVIRTANKPQILGHVIAHEIGHELLDVEGHSPTGIMRGDWAPDDLRQASFGELLFTPEEAEALRSEVARRANTHGTLESPQTDAPSSSAVH